MFVDSILLKRGLRNDAIWTQRYVYRSVLRYIPLFLDTFALNQSQFWPRHRIDRLQDLRLSDLFKDAQKVQYWKSILPASDSSALSSVRTILSSMPITSKKDLVALPLHDIADVTRISQSDPDHTSGSTGRPFHFFQDWGASLRSFAVTERTFRATGPRYPIVFMRARPRNGFTFYRHIWFFLRSCSSIRYRIPDLVRLSAKFPKGYILYGYTSWVLDLIRRCEQLDVQLPLRAVMTAGEYLVPDDRAYVERVTGAPVFTLYASRETGFLGFECDQHAVHINEEWALVEIVNDAGQALPYGTEGRIAITAFDNRVMPFIRYEIGDRGIISDTPCACGRTLRTIEFRGRTTEFIRFDDDRIVSLLDIAYAIGTCRDAIVQYQIVQKAPMHFVFRVVTGPEFVARKAHLEGLMVRLLHPQARVEWEIVDLIAEAGSGKAQYFIRDIASL